MSFWRTWFLADACGALVVSRHGCAPAMPTRVELDYFLAHAREIPRPDRDATLTRLHRVTAPRAPRDEVLAFAFDHRPQFFALAQDAQVDEARIGELKSLFVDAVASAAEERGLARSVGVLCDDRYGQRALDAATGRGWWIGRPVERGRPRCFRSSSDSEFQYFSIELLIFALSSSDFGSSG